MGGDMKTNLLVLLALMTLGTARAADTSDTTGDNILYEFKDGKASLLLKGASAERLYARLTATPVRIDDADAPCNMKRGQNVSCYSRRDKNEIQCVISIADTATGKISK
jgi:hypothetical protein